MNLDTVSFVVTQPNTGLAMTLAAGDPANIRNSVRGKDIFCIGLWAKGQVTSGFSQVIWPSGHDLVRGFRARHIFAQVSEMLGGSFPLSFKPQDPLTATQSGSNVAGDVQTLTMLMWYEDLPGVDAHLITLSELRKRGVQTLTVEDTITTAGGGAGYSGPRAINAGSDLLKADTEYAILGGMAAVICGALTIRGPDTGNLRVALPGNPTEQSINSDYFVKKAEEYDLPCIPVFNSANRAGTFVEALQDENNTAVPFSLNLCELRAPTPK